MAPGDPPPAPGGKCESCAASKRLKTAPPDGGESSHWYAKQPCSCTQVAGVSIASALAAASPTDALRPRRLFDADDDDATALRFDEEPPPVPPSLFDVTDDDNQEVEFTLFRAGGTELASEGGNGRPSQNSSAASPLLRPASAPPKPSTPSPLSMMASGSGSGFGGSGARWPSPPPPPLLPSSSLEARWNLQSPGLALAAARLTAARDGGGSSCSSSCATPSRAPLPLRPPTPGAPGSNIRRTTCFIDALDDESPGATPERAADRVPMSLTDTALQQLTMSLTSISIGPIGSKRSIDERDA